MRLPALVLLVAALASCSKDPVVVTGPTASPAPSATATPTVSPTPAATRAPAIDGDVDGDGTIDVIRPSEGRLTVVLSGSGRSVSVDVHQESPGNPGLLGSRDVDRDGFAEVFLETASGASTTFATPYRFDGTALHELQLNGEPARLGIGGGVSHGDGFACLDDGRLEVRSAESQDGVEFTIRVDTYRLAATDLQLVSSASTKGAQGEAPVEASYQVRCGSVGDGG